MATLEGLFNYYLANQAALVEEFDGKHLVIVENRVAGAFDSSEAAYDYAVSNYELGTFLIQLCTAGCEAYTQWFPPRVVF